MKNCKLLFTVILIFFSTFGLLAQGRGGHRGQHRHKRVVVVKRSVYRPARVTVYHPHWRPAYSYHRRWIFFPRYNLYWDNWRNQYVFWNGNAWLVQAAAPPVIVNVNLEKDKSVELTEDEDDDDDVYRTNNKHQTEYKNE